MLLQKVGCITQSWADRQYRVRIHQWSGYAQPSWFTFFKADWIAKMRLGTERAVTEIEESLERVGNGDGATGYG
jgi:hypothetical protein